MPAPFAAHLNLFFHFAESLCDTLVLASSALLLHLSALQSESGSMSVDFWPLKYYGALLLIQNCLLLHSVALRKVKDPPPKIRGAAEKKCLPSS